MNLNAQQCQFLLENGFNNNDVFLLSNHLHSKSVFTEIKTYLESKNKPVLLNAREIMTLVESQGYSHKNLHAVINHYPTLSNYFAKDTLLKWGSHSRGSRYIEAVSNNLDALFSLGLTADNIDYLNSTYSGYKKIECIPRYFPALLAKNYALKDLIALLAQNEGVKKIHCLSVGSRPTTPYSLKLIDALIALYQQIPIEESKMLETDDLIEWRGFKFANLLNNAITIDLIQSSLGSYNYQIFVKNREKLTEWFLSQGIIFPVQSANTNNIQSLIQLFSDNSNIATEVINNNAINFDDLSMFFLDDANDSSLCETNIVSNFAQEIQNLKSHLSFDSHDQGRQSHINHTASNEESIIEENSFLLDKGFDEEDIRVIRKNYKSSLFFAEIKKYLDSENKPIVLNAKEITGLVQFPMRGSRNLSTFINAYPVLSTHFSKGILLKWGSHSNGYRYIEAVSNNLDALFSLGLTADNIDYLNSTYSGYKKIECIPRYFPALLAKNYALKDLIALLAQNEGVKKIQCLSVGSRPTTPYSLKLIDTLIALYQQPPIEESKMLETDELIEWRGFKFANLLNKAITIDLIQSSLGSYSYQIFVKNKEKLTEWFLSQGIIFPVQSANTNNIQSLIQLFSDNSNIATEVINNNAINFDDLSMFFLDDVNDSSLCETNIVSNFAQEIQNFESHLVVDSHDQEHQSPINDTPSNKSIIEENSFLLNTGFDEEDIRVIRKHYKSTLLFAEIKKYFDSENKPIVLNAKEIMGLFRFPRSVSRNLSQFIDAYPALSTHFSKDILLKWVSHLMGYKNIEAVSNNLDALFSLGLTAADISYLNSKTTGYHKIECIPFYFPALLAKKYALNDLIAVLAQIGGDKKIKDLYKGKCPTTNWPAQLIESLVAVYQNQSTAQFKTPEMDEPIIFKTSKFDTKYHTLFQAVTINPLKSTTGRYSYLFILKNKENLKNWLFLRGIIFPTLTVAPDDTITIDSNNTSEEINNTSEDINDNPVDFDELRALLLSQSNEYSVPYNRACETQTQSLPAPYPDSVSHQVPTTVINNKSTFFYTDKMDTSPQPSTSRRSPQRSNHSVFLFDSPTSGNPASKIRKLDENDTPFGDQRSPKSPQ